MCCCSLFCSKINFLQSIMHAFFQACVPKVVLCDLTDDCGDMSDETLPECQITIQDSFESDDQPFGLFHQV